jgi:hypothetical protein
LIALLKKARSSNKVVMSMTSLSYWFGPHFNSWHKGRSYSLYHQQEVISYFLHS